MTKLYPLLGIAAPVVYVLAVVIGAALRSEYDPIGYAISELTVAGAPNKLLLDILFGLYNLAMLLFGLGNTLWATAGGRIRAIGGMLLTIGALGLAMFFFPMDARGTAPTWQGVVHLVMAGLLSLLTIVSILTAGLCFGQAPGLRGLRLYSLISCAAVLMSGGAAAAAAAQASPILGLLERITIGAFMVWVFVLGWRLWVLQRRP